MTRIEFYLLKSPIYLTKGLLLLKQCICFRQTPPQTWRTSEGEQLMQNQNPENKVSHMNVNVTALKPGVFSASGPE